MIHTHNHDTEIVVETDKSTTLNKGWVNIYQNIFTMKLERGYGIWPTEQIAREKALNWLLEVAMYEKLSGRILKKDTYLYTIPISEWGEC